MKKNIMMRISAILLVAVLLTTCVISGTFAKYVSSDDGSDEARVAKWGVEINLDGFDAFDEDYGDAVTSVSEEKIVAPGTEGSLGGVSLTGTTEVKVEVKYEATLTLENWNAGGAPYCPLEITVGSTTYKVGETVEIDETPVEITDQAKLIEVVEAAIEGYTAVYDANHDLSTAASPAISWAWDYEGNDDVKDTALGQAAHEGTSVPTVSLEITVTVTQQND